MRCWGISPNGEIGLDNTEIIGDDESPNTSVLDVNFGEERRARQVAAGWRHTCALFDTGKVRCWGLGHMGQLGNGRTDNWGDSPDRTVAAQQDVRLNGKAIQVVAGYYHSCALLETGNVQCWGNNRNGQLGLGNDVNMGDNETALDEIDFGPNTKAVQVAAGDWHTCALLSMGAVRCWGSNAYGQLGLGHSEEQSTTIRPSSPSHDAQLGDVTEVTRLAAGGSHS